MERRVCPKIVSAVRMKSFSSGPRRERQESIFSTPSSLITETFFPAMAIIPHILYSYPCFGNDVLGIHFWSIEPFLWRDDDFIFIGIEPGSPPGESRSEEHTSELH